MTDVVIHRLHSLPISDYTHERKLFAHIQVLTRVINHISNNINQVTASLHVIRKTHRHPGHEFIQFNRLFQA